MKQESNLNLLTTCLQVESNAYRDLKDVGALSPHTTVHTYDTTEQVECFLDGVNTIGGASVTLVVLVHQEPRS